VLAEQTGAVAPQRLGKSAGHRSFDELGSSVQLGLLRWNERHRAYRRHDGCMSALAHFIHARIADDETAARDLLRQAQEAELSLRSPQWLGNLVPGGHSWASVQSMAARVLAECESKRQILQLCGADPHEPGALLLRVQTDAVVRLLALPYAEHPDYDESWRP
jgi:hypothetical protein